MSDQSPQTSASMSPRRRMRDRIVDREGTDNTRLQAEHRLQNHLLLFDDDIRETALALGDIERFLARALATLERQNLTRAELEVLAGDLEVEARVVSLDESLASLKQRLRVIAGNLE